MDYTLREFNEIYENLCYDLMFAPKSGNTRELNNVTFTVHNLDSVFSTVRNPSLKYLCAELIWYMAGSNDVHFIGQYASLWNKITDDGKTSNSAYGYLIKEKHGFDQLYKVVELLREDPTSRRAVININVPNANVIETKDEPCTIALQFLVRNNALNCTAMMRSNDVWTGLPYDIIFFTILQKIIADKLGVGYGTYTHFATSMHVYLNKIESLEKMLQKSMIYDYRIDHKKLEMSAEDLYKAVTPENIVDFCREMKVLMEV